MTKRLIPILLAAMLGACAVYDYPYHREEVYYGHHPRYAAGSSYSYLSGYGAYPWWSWGYYNPGLHYGYGRYGGYPWWRLSYYSDPYDPYYFSYWYSPSYYFYPGYRSRYLYGWRSPYRHIHGQPRDNRAVERELVRKNRPGHSTPAPVTSVYRSLSSAKKGTRSTRTSRSDAGRKAESGIPRGLKRSQPSAPVPRQPSPATAEKAMRSIAPPPSARAPRARSAGAGVGNRSPRGSTRAVRGLKRSSAPRAKAGSRSATRSAASRAAGASRAAQERH